MASTAMRFLVRLAAKLRRVSSFSIGFMWFSPSLLLLRTAYQGKVTFPAHLWYTFVPFGSNFSPSKKAPGWGPWAERGSGHHPAVLEAGDPVGNLGQLLVVGDHDEGLVEGLGGELQQPRHVLGGFSIEAPGGLVRQGGGRAWSSGARAMAVHCWAPPERVWGRASSFPVSPSRRVISRKKSQSGRASSRARGEEDVLLDGEFRHQMVPLKDKADLAPAVDGELLLGEAGQVLAVHGDRAAVGGGRGRRCS